MATIFSEGGGKVHLRQQQIDSFYSKMSRVIWRIRVVYRAPLKIDSYLKNISGEKCEDLTNRKCAYLSGFCVDGTGLICTSLSEVCHQNVESVMVCYGTKNRWREATVYHEEAKYNAVLLKFIPENGEKNFSYAEVVADDSAPFIDQPLYTIYSSIGFSYSFIVARCSHLASGRDFRRRADLSKQNTRRVNDSLHFEKFFELSYIGLPRIEVRGVPLFNAEGRIQGMIIGFEGSIGIAVRIPSLGHLLPSKPPVPLLMNSTDSPGKDHVGQKPGREGQKNGGNDSSRSGGSNSSRSGGSNSSSNGRPTYKPIDEMYKRSFPKGCNFSRDSVRSFSHQMRETMWMLDFVRAETDADGNRCKVISRCTGVCVHESGIVLSASHGYTDGSVIRARAYSDSEFTNQVDVVKNIPERDLIMLKVTRQINRPFYHAELAKIGDLLVGQPLLSIGHPDNLLFSTTTCFISYPAPPCQSSWQMVEHGWPGNYRTLDSVHEGLEKVLLISTVHGELCPGNFGSPLFDVCGSVVGLFSFDSSGEQHAIHVAELRRLIKKSRKTEKKETAKSSKKQRKK